MAAAVAVDRIAILGSRGSVSTIRPDGTDPRVVSPGGRSTQQQVAWGPGGKRLAWGRAEGRGPGQARSSLVSADPDGGDQMVTPLPTTPFYLWWRPDGRALACLANGPQGIDLVLVEPGGPARVALRGAPLFVSWSPDGTQLVGHVADDRRVVVVGNPGAEGYEGHELARSEGFSAPAWTAEGIVADVTGPDGRRLLAVLDPATGAVRRPLARHDDWARVVATGGTRVAFCVGPLEPGRDLDVLMEEGEAIPGALSVVDLATGSLDVVLASPPVAAEWSPDGRRLLVLAADHTGGGPPLVRWLGWDGALARPISDPFTPGAWWTRTELAFAEQFGQSRRTWSPDSRSITYAVRQRSGGDVIVVQSADPDADTRPIVLSPGLASSWSPA